MEKRGIILQKKWAFWQEKNSLYKKWFKGMHPRFFSILWQILEEKTLELVPHAQKEDEILLDIGCGDGRYLVPTARCKGYNSVGIDPNNTVSMFPARMRLKTANLSIALMKGVGEFIPLKTSTVSIIMCNSTLDHVLDIVYVVKEIRRVLKDDGTIVLWQGIYNHQPAHSTTEQETHLRSFTAAELICIFEKNGFLLSKTLFLGFDLVPLKTTKLPMKIPSVFDQLVATTIRIYLSLGKIFPKYGSIVLLRLKRKK